MLPRYRADYRTLLWALLLFPLVPALGYAWPARIAWLLPLAVYTSYCAGVLTHNHTHVPVFTSRRANDVYGAWLSIFYGCPIAFWIPAHLENHHRHLNGPGDATRTDRLSSRNDAWHAFVYSLACARWQLPLVASYVGRAYARRDRHWRVLCGQAAALVIGHGGMLALALALHGGAGVWIYALTLGVPAALASTFMQLTNYVQHVHCDPASADDHSRNFVNRTANWFVFDGGYHTVHHERPSVHWSRYAELHRQRSGRIRPSLCQTTMFSFCFEAFVLGAWSSRFRTRPLGVRATTQRGAAPPLAGAAPGELRCP